MAGCNETVSRLLSITDEILGVRELPRTVLEARSLLSRHEQHVANVLRLPTVCALCSQHDGQTELNELQSDVEQFGEHAVVFRFVSFISVCSIRRHIERIHSFLTRACNTTPLFLPVIYVRRNSELRV